MDLILETSNGTKYSMPIGDRNMEEIRNQIIRTDHPHPGLLVLIILLVILLIYYVYVTRHKLDLSGEWMSDDYIAEVNHNVWLDTLSIKINDKLFGGWVEGSAVFILAERGIETSKGVYNKKKIHWVDNGVVWYRPYTL